MSEAGVLRERAGRQRVVFCRCFEEEKRKKAVKVSADEAASIESFTSTAKDANKRSLDGDYSPVAPRQPSFGEGKGRKRGKRGEKDAPPLLRARRPVSSSNRPPLPTLSLPPFHLLRFRSPSFLSPSEAEIETSTAARGLVRSGGGSQHRVGSTEKSNLPLSTV